MKRYVSIWFRHLLVDRVLRRQPELAEKAFVLAWKERGRILVKASSREAKKSGIEVGMVLADARAMQPGLEVLDYDPQLSEKLLRSLAEWAIRYSPLVAVDAPDGLILDATGLSYLWGNELEYMVDITARLGVLGYEVRTAMADTITASWAVCRYGEEVLVPPGEQFSALLPLPPHALRLEQDVLVKMQKLGLYRIKSFIYMPPSVLRRRFGQFTLDQIGKALGSMHEPFEPVLPLEPYQERLTSMEPIVTAVGIKIALQKLLEILCARLAREGKGARQMLFKCFRVDGQTEQIQIGTSGPSCSVSHLFRLFELKISGIEPALGIELFILEIPVVDMLSAPQEKLWDFQAANKLTLLSELVDRLVARAGADVVHRYLPAEHHWPEKAISETRSLTERPVSGWRKDIHRPILLLDQPHKIIVSAPIPDYPPMLFRYKGSIHRITKAEGPNRIEQEWWLSDGLHRDYYAVEDENGSRYWIFRSGHYHEKLMSEWFIHGFFA